jgi:hypothetical protein
MYKMHIQHVPGNAGDKDILGEGNCMKKLCCLHDYAICDVMCARFCGKVVPECGMKMR